jgi:O-antigen/teichoic acid export membrane protein
MVGRLLNFLLVPLYTASLGKVDEYGQVNVMFSYAAFIAVIAAFGLETGFFNFARKKDEYKPEKVFSTAVIALLCSGVLWLLLGNLYSEGLMRIAGYPSKPHYAVWFTAILAADAISSLGFAWLRFTEKPWRFVLVRSINIGVNVGLNLFFLWGCPLLLSKGYTWVNSVYDPARLLEYIFLSNLVASLITLPLLGRVWINLKWGFDFGLFKKLLIYSLPMVVVGLAGMINETLDRILLKKILPVSAGDYEAGIYGAFYKLSMVMTLFVQAFRFAAEPFFFKQAESDKAPLTYARVMSVFVYVCGFIYVSTLACLHWLAPLLIRKQDYFTDARGIQIVPVLLMANWLLGIYYNLSIWYKLSNKTTLGAYTALFGAGITLIGNIIFIPEYSFISSAWTTLAAYGGMVLLGYFWGQRHYPVPYKSMTLISIMLFAAILGYMALVFQEIIPYIAYLTIPAYLLAVWLAEAPRNASRKNH